MELLRCRGLRQEGTNLTHVWIIASVCIHPPMRFVCGREFFFRVQGVRHRERQTLGAERHPNSELQVDKVQPRWALPGSKLKVTHLHLRLHLLLNPPPVLLIQLRPGLNHLI